MNTTSTLSAISAPQPASEPVLDSRSSSAPPAAVPADPTAQEATTATGPKSGAIQMSSVLGVVEALSDEEGIDYLAWETVIDTGWHGFVDVGLALAQIWDRRLYRVDFTTFEAYCRVRWQFGRRYVDRVISAAGVVTHLRTNGSQIQPEHERQVRPLVGLPLEQGQQGWELAIQKAGGRKITERLVKSAVKELLYGR